MTVVALGVVGLLLVFVVWLGGEAVVRQLRQQATTAADAAALAAAPVTFLPFGAEGPPESEAARFARLNGAQFVSCSCRLDPSFEPRTVDVRVIRSTWIPLLGPVTVEATGRAEFVPAKLLEE